MATTISPIKGPTDSLVEFRPPSSYMMGSGESYMGEAAVASLGKPLLRDMDGKKLFLKVLFESYRFHDEYTLVHGRLESLQRVFQAVNNKLPIVCAMCPKKSFDYAVYQDMVMDKESIGVSVSCSGSCPKPPTLLTELGISLQKASRSEPLPKPKAHNSMSEEDELSAIEKEIDLKLSF